MRVDDGRNPAIIGLMRYTFARVSAMVNMKTEDYYQNDKCWWIWLHEKGGKRHEVPLTTMRKRISMPILMRPASVTRKKRRSSGVWIGGGS